MIRLLMTGLCFYLISCKKLIEYSPNEVRLKNSEKNLNATNISMIESAPPADSIRFVVTGDTQRFYDDLENFVASVNSQNDISFVVINGDITDFGQGKEFEWVNRILVKLQSPYVAVIGNHDMLANGQLAFHEMFGPDNFTFTCNQSKFICLNSCSREKGFDGSLPDLSWLSNQLTDLSEYKSAFVICHVPPFHEDFDPKLSEPYNALLEKSGKVHLSIHGHDERYSDGHPYEGSIEYLVTTSMKQRSYAIVSVKGETYRIEKVDY